MSYIPETMLSPAETAPGLIVRRCRRDQCEEIFMTSVPVGREGAKEVFGKLAEAVRDRGGRIVGQQVVGMRHEEADQRLLQEAFGDLHWPITWVDGDGITGLWGTRLWAVVGPKVTTVTEGDRVVASWFDDAYTRVCRIGGIIPRNLKATPSVQTAEVFDIMRTALEPAEMGFLDILRTWFYNDDILGWYDDFNEARDGVFKAHGVYENRVPASTGIGGSNPFGSALIAGAFAARPLEPGSATIQAVGSPLQNPALDYGSSFSRAAEVDAPDHRRLFISGTASINAAGDTVYLDDTWKQIEWTMQVVGAILKSRDMRWADVVQSIVYLKHPEDIELWDDWLDVHDLKGFPAIVAHNTVCRDDLLFEIELDALLIK